MFKFISHGLPAMLAAIVVFTLLPFLESAARLHNAYSENEPMFGPVYKCFRER
jgi:hypothetical protein